MKKIEKSRRLKDFKKYYYCLFCVVMCLTGCKSSTEELKVSEVVEIELPESYGTTDKTEKEVEELVAPTIPLAGVEKVINETLVEANAEEYIVSEEEEVKKKTVALTFDDGPSKYTSELVDILDDYNARATFFVVGCNIPANSDGVVKAYLYNNEIGVHGYSHTSFTKLTTEELVNEIDTTRSILSDLGVDYSKLVRPPYGNINDSVRESVDASFILWSVDTEDWKSRDVESIKQEVYKAIGEGDIILFHDVYPTTIEAIRELLPELSEEYNFVTVSELYKTYGYELEEHSKYYRVRTN